MPGPWRQHDLPEIVATLAGRPGHESVRTMIAEILRHGFGASYAELDHEVRMPEVRGRADTLFGATVFEFKHDLGKELPDVLAKLPDYLASRENRTGRRYIGIATDGATFIAYHRGETGELVEDSRFDTRPDRPDALLAWLEPALSDRDDLRPEPLIVQRELGRHSLTFGRANAALRELWIKLSPQPDVRLKRDLWDSLLREVYGDAVGDDSLFIQHTYLTIVAKTIAARVLDIPIPSAAEILSGTRLVEAGIHGAVESDFFDWVLSDPAGHDLALRIARQAARFRLQDVETDVLKALYESLIDPAQRHDLGEYYTPDWLAAKVTAAAIADPLTGRVLDPACGSGTFLFHALRRLLAAADAAGWARQRAVAACAAQVRGIDVHPLAVIIARVTWLLALGPAVTERPAELHVPVFLGDTMQWNLHELGGSRAVVVPVPGDRPLRIPAGFAETQEGFENSLRIITEGLAENLPRADVERRLARMEGASAADAAAMADTYEHLLDLYRSGRNGIWSYVLRNLRRPLWLSRADQRADVVIGNPPWVAYRHLSPEMQSRLREACQRMNLWHGGRLATQQDLSALFWARAAERYLKPRGTIAFLMPFAALNRPAYAGLRRGDYRRVGVAFREAWSFDETVQPLFPVPASVLIARRDATGVLPSQIWRFSGHLLRRDATETEADRNLTRTRVPWPASPSLAAASPYRAMFRQGATIVPRRFFLVERESAGRIGSSPAAPRVRGKTGPLDKPPWNTVPPPHGPIEKQFLHPVLLGESIAPFHILDPALAVIPIDGSRIHDARSASSAGYRHLAAWLGQAEAAWAGHAAKKADGTLRMTLTQQLDYI
ncbi:MAG: N-6 DNA methylase, partial [Acetobacteraceae bacterium]